MIKYLYDTSKECGTYPLKVRLDGKLIGEIRKTEGGFWYVPKGQKTGGNVFATITLVQRTLWFQFTG